MKYKPNEYNRNQMHVLAYGMDYSLVCIFAIIAKFMICCV